MPAGLDDTVPVPLPAFITTSSWLAPKAAVTVVSPVGVNEHASVPLHAPPQPRKVASCPGVAASSPRVLTGTDRVHAPGQLTPPGVDATVPLPISSTVIIADAGPGAPMPASSSPPSPMVKVSA